MVGLGAATSLPRRQDNIEARAARFVGLVTDRAAMTARDGIADRQSQARAVFLRGEERVEEALPCLSGQTGAVVDDRQLDRPIGRGLGTNDNLAASNRARTEGLEAVTHEVQHHLLDL